MILLLLLFLFLNLSFLLCGFEAVLLSGISYDLNEILQNETFNNIHTIYLTIVDIILWLGVVYLAAKLLQNILGGIAGEGVDMAVADEESYQNYSRYQRSKDRYKKEHGGK